MNESRLTLRLWFFEISLKHIPKSSFVGKRNVALFFRNRKIFKF